MKINELTEDGRIVKGVNTTPDVQPGETERQAKKLFPMNKNGKPQSLGVPGASPNVAFNLGLTEDELTTVQRAELFAQQAHKDHQRKYTGDPYYVHLDEVRRIVKGAGGSEDMQAAALLHDTVEDTSVTSQDIMKEFGSKIAKLVVELTDISKPEDGNRAVRKAMDRDKLASASAEAQTIKYADLISNGKDIMQNDPKFAKVYMKEKADLLRVMTKGDSRLRSAALAMLPDELKENMSVTGTERRRLEKKKGLEIGSPEWFKHWFDLPYLREDASPIQKVDIQQLEKFADRLFGKVGIDVEFTRHFMDRVNDVRNQKPITMSELTRLFKQEYKRWGKPIAQMGPDAQAVMKDLQTDINLPFVLKWDEENNELDLIAKTVMRKADFKTPNKEFPVESVPTPITKKDAALSKQAKHLKMKSMLAPRPVATMVGANKGFMDTMAQTKQDADTLSKAAGIDPNLTRNAVANTMQNAQPNARLRAKFGRQAENVAEAFSTNILKQAIDSIADSLGINKNTALAIAHQESGLRQNIVGDKTLKNKAYGLYQVRKPALDDVNRLYKTNYTMDDVAKDPMINAEVGLRYYKAQKDFYGAKTDAQALRGYNGGPGAITGKNKKANQYSQSVQATTKSFADQYQDINPPRYYDKIDNPQTVTNVTGPKARPTNQVPSPIVRQKVNYNQLAKASNIADPNKIYPGQTINLPGGSTYTVKSGDTLSKIAQNYNKGIIGENIPSTNKPGTIGQMINWGGKNAPDKPKSNISVARRNNKQEPLNWWQKTLQKGRDLFDDEQLELKKKFEITDELKKLDSIFKKSKHEIRIVGGAVRDLALGKSPKDIDLATDATPQEMQAMFDSAGVRHIPTGIEHGTITAVINDEPFEITTLRADVETDGRRAEVEFVRSWEEDAKRRDLTYNAMSMDFDGNLYDYHGGMDDLQDKVTKFVGDPAERIKEDYLRTLRYFRFQGRLDTPTFDRDTMNAIADNIDGLKQLSVERVWMEMGKILNGGNIQQILGAMDKTGVLDAIGLNYKPSQELMDGGDPIINLARITDDESIGTRWKMSNEEKGKLGFLLSEKGKTHSKDWYTNMMVDGFDRTQLDALARYNNQDDMIQHIKTFKAPEFPVDGNDLIKMGHERGPKIGQTLQALRAQWKAGNFSASKDELLQSMNEETPFGVIARKASHVINKSQYEKAAQFLHNILQRKYQETGGKLRHTLGYYAQMIANQTGNKINWRELKAEYLDQFGNAMFEKINKNTSMGDVIDDFYKSDAPQFKGKSKEKRRQMAIAAKLSMMDSVDENFADGKKPGRKGLSKRVGIPKNATIAQLEKIAKNSTGERRRMAQWQLNMRRGKNKKK